MASKFGQFVKRGKEGHARCTGIRNAGYRQQGFSGFPGDEDRAIISADCVGSKNRRSPIDMHRIIWIAFLLLSVTASGCAGSRLSSQAKQIETLDDVNDILTGRRAEIHFINGELVRKAHQIRISKTLIEWTDFRGKTYQRDVHEVERVMITRRGTATWNGLGLGAAAGFAVGLAVGAYTMNENGGWFQSLGVFGSAVKGMKLGGAAGLIFGITREPEDARIEVYQRPLERYTLTVR